MDVRVHRVGRTALLLEDDDVAGWHGAVRLLVAQGRLAVPRDLVPGARTLLLDGVDVAAAERALEGASTAPVSARVEGPVVELPVVYDGPDLAEVARLWEVDERAVVARHTATTFTVAFCGFAPGFPYLTGLAQRVPRRATPRTRVPAGSVALADRWCGVYPTASPGGWQLLGRTCAPLFDPDRDPPALLPPGTRVRFVEVARLDPPVGRLPVGHPVPARAVEVVRAGARTLVQDLGRPGRAALGVPRSGALDAGAARLANRLVGNPEDAAVLETTLDGVALRARSAVTVAVTGALAPVSVDGRAVSWGCPEAVLPGQVLDVGTATTGVRCCVAVAGGFAVAPVLGSRSTDTLSGLGPPPLAAGHLLPVGPWPGLPPGVVVAPPAASAEVVLRVVPGPRADWLGPGGLAALLEAHWELSPDSDRVGARLLGPPFPRRDGELDSEGTVRGGVQLPPDGRPVVLLADAPTTGGYPVVAVVDPRDLDALAQARPGARVRLVPGGHP